jgi:hypothetical protein
MDEPGIDFQALGGRILIDADEKPLGQVNGVFLDRYSDEPKWISVTCQDERQHVVPFTEPTLEGTYVKVPYIAGKINASPTVVAGGVISSGDEERLFTYYGRVPLGAPPEEMPIGPEEGAPPTEVPIGPEGSYFRGLGGQPLE